MACQAVDVGRGHCRYRTRAECQQSPHVREAYKIHIKCRSAGAEAVNRSSDVPSEVPMPLLRHACARFYHATEEMAEMPRFNIGNGFAFTAV